MEMTSAIPPGNWLVDTYAPGRFRVGGHEYSGSILITPQEGVRPWPITRPEDIDESCLDAVLQSAEPPEILLVGCAQSMVLLPKGLRQRFHDARIGLDPMGTGAACRTFNVLISENRKVGAALIAL